MSFWIRNRKKGTITSFSIAPFPLGLMLLILLLAIVIPIITRMANRLVSAPGAAMYRTEANLTAIESAIRAYTDRYDALPPSGKEGLQRAIDELNRDVTFYPEGVPKDGWDRDYIYANSDDYPSEHSLAIKDAGSGLYRNPGGYQLYSVGADGKRGPEDGPMAGDRLNDDNINNWDDKRSWRTIYRRRSQRIRDVRKE